MSGIELYTINSNIDYSAIQPTPCHATQTIDTTKEISGIYLHIPFCFHKCHYCDFYSIVDSDPQEIPAINTNIKSPIKDRQPGFVDRLVQEIRSTSVKFKLAIRTIFFGGGTPTLLRSDLWQSLIRCLETCIRMDQLEEWTVEANPETVTEELLSVLVNGGVNRISIGAQSFHPHLLKTLERHHDPANIQRAVQQIRTAGIDNINLDLIFGIPGQTLDDLQSDLDSALALEPEHLSCYGLTYEPNTAMTQRLRQGQFKPVNESLEAQMYAMVIDRLADAGYEHYEISNWAKPGRQCQHNLLYWHNENWLGLGPSAASHVAGYRWKNQAHLGQYLASAPHPPTTDHEYLPQDQRTGEQLMLGLRLRRGVSLAWLGQQLQDDDPRWDTIGELQCQGLLQRTASHLRLTTKGLFLADSVIAKLL